VETYNYNEEKMLRGMVIENLTQRTGDFREETGNLVAVRDMLKEHPEWLIALNIFKATEESGRKIPPERRT